MPLPLSPICSALRAARSPILATALLGAALLAPAASVCAQTHAVSPVAQGAQALGQSSAGSVGAKAELERIDRGLVLKARHCGGGSQTMQTALAGQLKVEAEGELLDLFQRILCAPSSDGMGKIEVERFGEAAADPFATGFAMYSDEHELGQWPVELENEHPRSVAFISILGLSPDSPIPGVSLWQVGGADQVRVWYAPFWDTPSDAMTYDFELREGRWVWVAAVSTTRI